MYKSAKFNKHRKMNINAIINIPTPYKYSRNAAEIFKEKDAISERTLIKMLFIIKYQL
jgi:hypothetical protein